jgi:uncharacterized delta-60 repeat protein
MTRKIGFEQLERRELMAEGSLLTTFGNQGVIRDSNFHSLMPDEKIAGVVAKPGGGFFVSGTVFSGRANVGVVVAYLNDGNLDKQFGKDGKAFVPLGQGNEWQTDLALQPDGKIVVAGFVRDSTLQATSRIALSRLNSNGSIDPNFGRDGVVIKEMAFHASPTAIAVRTTGEILVYGEGANQLHLIQFLPNGSIDIGYGENGIRSIDVVDVAASDMLLLQDGSTIISASAKVSEGNYDAQVYRVSATGALDSNFGQGGKLQMQVAINVQNNFYELPLPLASTNDGNFILAGTFRDDNSHDFFAAKLTTSGNLVNGFGSNGVTTIDVNGTAGTAVHDIVVGSNGIAGFGYIPDGDGIAAAWLTADGVLQQTHRVDRLIDSEYFGSAVLAGQRIVFGTTSVPLTSNSPARSFDQDLQLVAFDVAKSQLDDRFGSAGAVTTNTRSVWSRSRALGSIELPSGQVLVAIEDGLTNQAAERPLFLKRYTAQGRLDTTFGDNGKKEVLKYLNYVGNLEPKFISTSSGLFLVVVNATQLQIAKLGNDGNFDITWGNAGWLTWDFSNHLTYLQDVLVEENAIYFGGIAGAFTSYRIGKLDLSGALQPSFGIGGLSEIPVRGNFSGSGIQLSLSADRIVALIANHPDDSGFAVSLVAFNMTGQIDTSFGTGGRKLTGITTGASLDLGRDVLTLPDANLLVFGKQTSFGGGNTVLERYLPNGQIDTNFGVSGSVQLEDGPFTQVASTVAVDSKGRIVVLRTFVVGLESITAVTRFNANGVLDSAFGASGTSQLYFDRFSEVIPNMFVASHDDLLISGSEVGLDDSHAIVARVIGTEFENASWNNPTDPFDTNADLSISPVDALLVINYLNSNKPRSLLQGRPRNEYLIDVSNDGVASPLDALLVINRLNRQAAGEGEAIASEQKNSYQFEVLDVSASLALEAEWMLKKRRR